jgi:hypothetical protein
MTKQTPYNIQKHKGHMEGKGRRRWQYVTKLEKKHLTIHMK